MVFEQLQAGQPFEHFRIEAFVIRTSMTSIYRATDLRTNQLVALKIPHPELECDPVFYNRFQREMFIGKKLNHPGVVRMFDSGDMNQLCIVMEWVEDGFLRQILAKEGKVSVERATRIATGVCEALDYIHSQGVVHRDLKPENIMVSTEDRIKLIDFGISACDGARRLTFSKLSNAMGTPDYIAPEQIKRKHMDGRTDVYALGVILFEMLTGQTPFNGPNPFAVMNDRLVNDPPSAREINPEISIQIQEILNRAMERDPENRFADAREFANALAHPESIEVIDRAVRKGKKPARLPWMKRILSYTMLLMIPLVIFTLILLATRVK
ncbi:MAG TPA: serine/threonine-protein kinase [Candidatus Saccharimonadales bacterium]|jgi:serine/threonine protein kinase|nr:serine/threonine-protein kinase [Candidatus Saccharimonadales bacterium]